MKDEERRGTVAAGTRVVYEGDVVIEGEPSLGANDVARGTRGTVIGDEPPEGVIVAWDDSLTCVVHRDDVTITTD